MWEHVKERLKTYEVPLLEFQYNKIRNMKQNI
jgi:hypothetical protein